MNNENEEFDEFIKRVKLVNRTIDLKNQQVIYDIINKKKLESDFKDLYNKRRKKDLVIKFSIYAFTIIFLATFSAIIIKEYIFNSVNLNKSIKTKAVYHIAYFEEINIIPTILKDINLKSNENAKLIFYHPYGISDIFIKNDTINVQPIYYKVEFHNLAFIFMNLLNNFFLDTNQNKQIIIIGNLPETPQEIIKYNIKQRLITNEQFQLLSKNNNLEIKIILNKSQQKEIESLISKFEEYNIKYKIIKLKMSEL